ncbi:MAG: cytochrome c biogenesis protein ResB [Bacteroidales bacterium]|jgi:hypothetical protein
MSEITKKPLFVFPWRFTESFIIAFFIPAVGFIIEYLSKGAYFGMLSFPYNVSLFIVWIIIISVFHFFLKFDYVYWLSSTPAAIAAVSVYAIQVLLLGFIPQEVKDSNIIIQKLGLTHITQSLQFIFSVFFLLIVLSFTILKRIKSFNKRNFGFFLNHFGLLVIIVAGSFGASDKTVLSLNMQEGDKLGIAFDNKYQHHKLPFKIELVDFIMETYNPELMMCRGKSKFISDKDGKTLFKVDNLLRYTIGHYEVFINKYLKSCKPSGSEYVPLDYMGATSAANIDVFDKEKNNIKIASGWISCGSIIFNSQILPIDTNLIIGMNEPQPKKYISKVRIYHKDGKVENETIEVNKPLKVDGWYIYQSGYDNEMGRWSTVSVLEFVNDPWLYVVYIGIFFLMAGACFMIWYDKLK